MTIIQGIVHEREVIFTNFVYCKHKMWNGKVLKLSHKLQTAVQTED